MQLRVLLSALVWGSLTSPLLRGTFGTSSSSVTWVRACSRRVPCMQYTRINGPSLSATATRGCTERPCRLDGCHVITHHRYRTGTPIPHHVITICMSHQIEGAKHPPTHLHEGSAPSPAGRGGMASQVSPMLVLSRTQPGDPLRTQQPIKQSTHLRAGLLDGYSCPPSRDT